MQKKVSNLDSKKVGSFGNIPMKVHKESPDICDSVLQDIQNYEI